MKSNSQVPFDDLPNDQKLLMSRIMLDSGVKQVNDAIDKFSSSNLKRVLKVLSHIQIANAILEKEDNFELQDKEKDLIDKIFALHESVMGHGLLKSEVEKGENNLEENLDSSLETDLTTNLEVSLEENDER